MSLYNERIDAMKAGERVWDQGFDSWTHDSMQRLRNASRLAAYKVKRTAMALSRLQRLGQEYDNDCAEWR
jgi:hypothetical protein